MNQHVKEWYEKKKHKVTDDNDWTSEAIELGKDELDERLLPKEEYNQSFDVILVHFYSIENEIVYTFSSNSKPGKILYGLLKENELKAYEYFRLKK